MVGSVNYKIITYTIKYYLPIGSTVLLHGNNTVPIVTSQHLSSNIFLYTVNSNGFDLAPSGAYGGTRTNKQHYRDASTGYVLHNTDTTYYLGLCLMNGTLATGTLVVSSDGYYNASLLLSSSLVFLNVSSHVSLNTYYYIGYNRLGDYKWMKLTRQQ